MPHLGPRSRAALARAALIAAGAALLGGAAAAQTIIPDVAVANGWAAFFRDNGVYAVLVALVGYVLWLLRAAAAKDERIYAMAAATAKLAGDTIVSMNSLEAAQKAAADINGERWAAVKAMSTDLVRILALVDGNGNGLGEVKSGLANLTTAFQTLLMRERR